MSSAAGLVVVPSTPARLTGDAARWIARAQADVAPDLTRCVVLLPRLHARAAFARALSEALGGEVVLLPRITTLRDWAGTVAAVRVELTSTAREALLYRTLADRGWLTQPDLWAVAAELGALFDELTRWRVELPRSADDFVRAIDRAYRARAGATFGFEARLVHELWHVLARSAGPDREQAYQQQLVLLAQEASVPIYAVGLRGLAPAEQAFLERAAERVPVTCFQMEADAGSSEDPVLATLAAAWPQDIASSLQARAGALRSRVRSSPLAARVRFFGAIDAEQEARAVDVSVRRWLLDGRRDIAIVVLDRVSARRARALLERAEVLVRDEAGWAFSTTSAATVIGRWFDAVTGDFHHRDLLDVLKSPFAFHDWPRASRQDAVWRFEQAIRAENLRSGLARFQAHAAKLHDTECDAMLARIARAERTLGQRRRRSLAAWLAALLASLDEIGVRAGLAADLAGAQLLQLLDTLAGELAADRLTLGLGDFRRWLARTLESTTFRDSSIESPVLFTSLDAMRLRRFDAVLLLGADADHLPGADSGTLFFNQGVRRELGLPGRAEQAREVEELLRELLSANSEVLVTWQRERDGEENLLAPVFDRLRVLHGLTWQEEGSLDDAGMSSLIASGALAPALSLPLPVATDVPAPRAAAAQVPVAISPSGYNVLMECPYRFHARYVLGLRELDEVQEEVRKSDYGMRIHDVLARFHRQVPVVGALSDDGASRLLDELSVAAFRDDLDSDYTAAAWLARWRACIPNYLDWQRGREAEGWRFSAAEAERRIEITTPGGRTLVLRGRIDRIDTRSDGAVAVLDYKTQSRKALSAKTRVPGEDVQLPSYVLMWGAPVADAQFVSLDRDKVETVGLGDIDIEVHADAVGERLGRLYDAIVEGAALTAQGAPEVCKHCEMQGLCRQAHWP